MEIQFQQMHHQNQKPGSKLKGRNKRTNNNNNKFVGVRQRPSGRWVAEIKDTKQKIRMWLGTFETAEEAARAYDEAACLLRGSNTRTNFIPHRVSADSPLASRIRNLLKIKKEAKQQSSPDSSSSNNHKISPISSSTSSNSISFTSCSVSNNNGNGGGGGDDQCLPTVQGDTQLFDDAYKPDLSNCTGEFDLGSAQSGLSWVGGGPGFDDRFSLNQDLFDVSGSVERSDELELSEFHRMRAERQISASLYAMSGVQECMESVDDPAEAFWDLPPLCSLLCWN